MLEEHYFFRTSRSDLVNLNHIVTFGQQKKPILTLTDDTTLTISIRRKEVFLKVIEKL